jgi:hypothetical protein
LQTNFHLLRARVKLLQKAQAPFNLNNVTLLLECLLNHVGLLGNLALLLLLLLLRDALTSAHSDRMRTVCIYIVGTVEVQVPPKYN